MTRALALLLLISSMTACAPRVAVVKPTQLSAMTSQEIASAVDSIIKSSAPHVNIGISIRSLATNKTIYEKNAQRHFVPCSTLKIITLAAALHYLGPSYRFSTKIFTDGGIKKDGSVNNIYLQGSGDPSLMDSDLVILARELAQRGIKKIDGDIVIDDFVFDEILWSRGNMWDDRSKGYAAPVGGLNVNYNRLQIKTTPSLSKNGVAMPIVWPKTNYVAVTSEAKNSDGKTALSISLERSEKRQDDWPQAINDGLRRGDKIIVKGQIAKKSDGHYTTVAINDPGMFAATLLAEELARQGVIVNGSIVRKATPVNAKKLAQHDSRSLAEALVDFTKISNNVGHDTVVKAIAAHAGQKPASSSAGLALIADFLTTTVGIDAKTMVTADGAGLSRYSLVTPEQMVTLINYAVNHFHLGAEFMAALSFGGEDGLLTTRLSNAVVKGNIRAKTGTMSGLSNLVGILTDSNGERYSFAIMINGFVGSATPYIALQDQILTTLLAGHQTQVANVK